MNQSLTLSGLDGSNPLAFLAGLGTLRALTQAWPDRQVKMAWRQEQGAWRPCILAACLANDETANQDEAVQTLAKVFKLGFTVPEELEAERKRTETDFSEAKKTLKKTIEKIKGRNLRGKERENVSQKEIQPLREAATNARTKWLATLSAAVPSAELSLGKDLSATRSEFRDLAIEVINDDASHERFASDQLAAFGSDACFDEKTERIRGTPFCFVTGSGHQYFLDSVRKLIGVVDIHKLKAAIFESWNHKDEKFSLRWDPVEDRRYATMWDNPTSPGNEAKTNWAANLLAYWGLSILPSVPTPWGLETTAFASSDDERVFSWPIWEDPIDCDVTRSLLALETIVAKNPNRVHLRARGVSEIFRARRIQVGNPPLHKINFAPAQPG